MLELIEARDTALDNYDLTGSLIYLGKYRKSVKELKKYIDDHNIVYHGIIDPLEEYDKKLSKVKATEKVEVDVDDSWQNADYSISVGAEYAD